MTKTFEQMIKRWHVLSASDDERDGDEFQLIEQAILNHEPANPAEGADILIVLARSLEGDVRSDGADIEAVERLAAYLRKPMPPLERAA